MRPALRRTAQALLPLTLCLVLPLPLLESNRESSESGPVARPTRAPRPRDPRYFANDSLVGQPVNCTAQEKECLRFNRLWFPAAERCYALGDGPARCRLAVDRCEFERGGGHLRGICVPAPADAGCPRTLHDHVRMAYDARCLPAMHIATVCGDGPVNLAVHFFGDSECVDPLDLSPSQRRYVPQPEEDGVCVFPNLRHDLTSVSSQERRVLIKECSERQSACFARRQVWCEHVQDCCDLLREGSCETGEWVVLERAAWEAGEVRAACAARLPCGNSSRLMAFDGKCYGADTVLRALCPGGVLLPNAFGEMACATSDYYRHVVELRSPRPMMCELTHRVAFENRRDGLPLEPECGITPSGRCVDAF